MADGGGRSALGASVSRVHRGIEDHFANPILRTLLRTRMHVLLSPWFMLISYEGRKSGRRFTIPVVYKSVNGAVIVVTPTAETNWWKNFKSGRQCRLWVEGKKRPATGQVVTGDEQRQFYRLYFQKFRTLGWILGFGRNAADSTQQLNEMKAALTLVRFDLKQE